jgi:dTDP-4-dehydrorhamnose reductase
VKSLELWGGLECTHNRVGDEFISQLEKSGHNKRSLSDLELFKSLGIKKLRYPCLWEEVAPTSLDNCNWENLDERLGIIQKLDIKIIAGLLHHGSGPFYTSLIDPDFPEKFATYARLFSKRFPWIEDFTPINEINTTARFSCLYGHWYPHLTDDTYYLKALLYQVKATVLAMREIRHINQKARLIQTDDLGKCQSTEPLKYQRDFENHRRWLAFDLLSGMVTKDHPLYSYFLKNKIRVEELKWFEENTCPPDVIGVNHYHLSNRFLDHRTYLYPECFRGGNDKEEYSDIGAVDTGQATVISTEEIFTEVWDRYKKPMAVTECHTRGHREAQMRWLYEIWQTANNLSSKGINFEAVTVWSLLGTYDWHTLCKSNDNFYEPGVFDLRHPGQKPMETGLSKLVRELATKGHSESPLLNSEGHWKNSRRVLWGAKHGDFTLIESSNMRTPVLITGATGTLGQAMARVCSARNIPYRLLTRQEMEISNLDSISAAIELYKPWAVINAAGYVKVDEAETNKRLCFQGNVQGAVNLAQICLSKEIKLVNFSSDLVFDGLSDYPYLESHQVSPVNIYGKSKAECELKVLGIYPASLVIRTSSFFGPWDKHNFITQTLLALINNREVVTPNDTFISPTYIPDLANETLNLLIDGESGIVHITNAGEVSWEKFAEMAALSAKDKFKINPDLIRGTSSENMNYIAKRPKMSVLKSERHNRLPTLENALERYLQELQVSIDSHRENQR